MMKLTFCLLALLLCINISFAEEKQEKQEKQDAVLKCYQCNENDNKGCGDPFAKDNYLEACVDGEKYCRKTVQYVDGKSSIVRQCGKEPFKGGSVGCYKTAGKSTQHVCTCAGDGCNSGNFIKSSALLLISSILLKLFF